MPSTTGEIIADRRDRGHPREGSRWPDWRNQGDAVHAMQDCREWLIRSCVSDKAVSHRGGCGHQKSLARQALQGMPLVEEQKHSVKPGADHNKNRELQIMRIVRHPNIVELKAFYYSNGERVS